MPRIITDYLDSTAREMPNKIAFTDDKREITFNQLQTESYHIAMVLIEKGFWKQPILIFMEKSVEVIAAFQGVSYSGNFYSPVDIDMPSDRIQKIVSKLNPAAIITNKECKDVAQTIIDGATIIVYEEALEESFDTKRIRDCTERIIDTDAMYVLFTSGSTGTPKGVIVSHRAAVDFTEWAAEELKFNEESIMGNQCPLYFSMSIYDIFETLKCGCTTHIIPQRLFSQPTRLMQFLDDKKINTLIWVPSILMFISTLKALDRPHLKLLKNIFFGAEVLQTKHLNRWMDEYPQVRFVNIYGPTEVTDTCIFYDVKTKLKDDEIIPIGKACRNKECFLLDGDDLVTKAGNIGEICVRGSGLAYGYYNDFERTQETFVQNPLNKAYDERIYRTGDLARYNEKGELVYVGRKDYQIKHRGHRIELGEIEAVVSALEGVEDCCCLYDKDKLRIVLFFSGAAEDKEVQEKLAERLPDYMVPGKRIKLDKMPKNINGKTNRQLLVEQI